MNPTPTPLRLVVLASGRGSNLAAMVRAIRENRLNARIEAVISNKPNAPALDIARNAGIAAVALDHTLFSSRNAFDQQLVAEIDRYAPDWVVLAGFMRILTPVMISRFNNRIINIHPSLLPAFPGLNTHQRALDAAVREHGATVHLVTTEVDAGVPIAQVTIPVRADDTAQSLADRVIHQEHVLFTTVLDWLARGRLTVEDHSVRLDGAILTQPIRLNPFPPADHRDKDGTGTTMNR